VFSLFAFWLCLRCVRPLIVRRVEAQSAGGAVGKMRIGLGLPRVTDLLPGVGTWLRDAWALGLGLILLQFYIHELFP